MKMIPPLRPRPLSSCIFLFFIFFLLSCLLATLASHVVTFGVGRRGNSMISFLSSAADNLPSGRVAETEGRVGRAFYSPVEMAFLRKAQLHESRLWSKKKKKYLRIELPDDPRENLLEPRFKDQRAMVEVLALKERMSTLFSNDGQLVPVTLLRVIPSVVAELLDGGKVLAAYEHPLSSRRFQSRCVLGQVQRVGSSNSGFGVEGATDMKSLIAQPSNEFVLGQVLDASLLVGATMVSVKGKPKGKGFEGVMQRHGFSGGPKTHGSRHHRAPGSIGAGTDPGRVLPGTRMAGRSTGPTSLRTSSSLPLLAINVKQNLLLVKGSVPGWRGRTLVVVRWNKFRQQYLDLKKELLRREAEIFLSQKSQRS